MEPRLRHFVMIIAAAAAAAAGTCAAGAFITLMIFRIGGFARAGCFYSDEQHHAALGES